MADPARGASPGTTPHRPSHARTPIAHGAAARRTTTRRVVVFALLLVCTVTVGWAASSSRLTSWDVRADTWVAQHRTPWATTLAEVATDLAQPLVGAVLAVVVPVVLWLRRRPVDAVVCGLLMGGSLAVTFVVKYLVTESRPPQRLWEIPPDSHWSYPSGHTTVAGAVAAALVVAVPPAARRGAVAIGGGVLLVVAWARVYLGVHYIPDVLGSCLAVGCAAVGARVVLSVPALHGRLGPYAGPGRRRAGRRRRPPRNR